MRLRLFLTTCLLGGIGGFLGSVAGAFVGQTALFVGGVLGGVLMAPLSAQIALWRGWIAPAQYWATAIGAGVGFLAAAVVAVNTLTSPVGPALSPVLVGLGALAGSRWRRAGHEFSPR